MLAAQGDDRRLLLEDWPLAESPTPGPDIGDRLGPWVLTGKLGEGGMGRVYSAERDDGQHTRRVAIKTVRPSRVLPSVLERFRLEQQVLARLDHPNIAGLLDTGITDDGLPYLVLQYVDGSSITEYCDTHTLSIRRRLELFTTVCSAVDYAHGHLVVHRDLKPSNVFMSTDGEPKLLDFGIAKLLAPQELDAPVLETRIEDRVATLQYAAPEQLNGDSITTATDVYALGALLCRLLVGRLPYRAEHQTDLGIRQAILMEPTLTARVALDQAPAGVDSDGNSALRVAANRAVSVERLRSMLSGDLGHIVTTALRKDPARRYSSAGHLGDDIRRYLSGRPIVARGDGALYLLRCFVGRHRMAVSASALVLTALIGLTTLSLSQAHRLTRERDLLALERQRSHEVVDTLVSLFETGAPGQGRGTSIPLDDFLGSAHRRAEALTGQPEVQARLFQVLGRIEAARGDARQGMELLERAWDLVRDQPLSDTSAAIYRALAETTTLTDDRPLIRQRLEQSVRFHVELYGEADRRTLLARAKALAAVEPSDALPRMQALLHRAKKQLPANDLTVANLMNSIGMLHWRHRQKAEAADYFRRSLAIASTHHDPGHPAMLALQQNLAAVLGPSTESIALMRQVLEQRLKISGPKSGEVAGAWNSLGLALAAIGDLTAALEAFTQARQGFGAFLGEQHWQTANAKRNVARVLQLQGDLASALPLLQDAWPHERYVSSRAGVAGHLAVVQSRLGDAQGATDTLERAVASFSSRAGGTREPAWYPLQVQKGRVFLQLGNPITARDALLEALGAESSLSPPLRAEAECALGRAWIAAGDRERGRAMLQKALPRYRAWPLADPIDVAAAEQALTAD